MGKKVVLVGHCGPDSSFLRTTVARAEAGITVSMADDSHALKAALDGGADLLLLNRELGYGFDQAMGVDVIRTFRNSYPNTKFMLVSNYADAQTAALAAGAVPGFGKREIGQPRVAQLIRDALNGASPAKSTATVATAATAT